MSVIVQAPRSRNRKARVADLVDPKELSSMVDVTADAPDYRIVLEETAEATAGAEQEEGMATESSEEDPPLEDEEYGYHQRDRRTTRDRRKATQGRKTRRSKARMKK